MAENRLVQARIAVVACNVRSRTGRRERIRTLVGSGAKQPRKADDLCYALTFIS
jgi:hypothetical protein